MIYTLKTYKEYLQKLMPQSSFDLLKFEGTEKPCSIRCKKCGTTHNFTFAYNIARRARRDCKDVCYKCENNKWSKKQWECFKKAQKKLEEKKTIELVKGLITWGSKEPAIWRCLKCGRTFSRSPFSLFNQTISCPWCETHPYAYTEEMAKEKAWEVWGDEYSIVQFQGITATARGQRRILVKHNKCGFIYAVDFWKFLNETGCPKCRASHGERQTRTYLNRHGFTFQEQKAFQTENKTFLRFDFYLEERGKRFAIELNGIQHYEPIERFGGQEGYLKQVERDRRKKKYCDENGIELIIIPYYDKELLYTDELAQRLRGQAP